MTQIVVRGVHRDVQERAQRVGKLEEQRLLHHRVEEGHRGDGEGEGHRGEADRANAAQGGGAEPGADVERGEEIEVGEGASEGVAVAEGRAENVDQSFGSKNRKVGATGIVRKFNSTKNRI